MKREQGTNVSWRKPRDIKLTSDWTIIDVPFEFMPVLQKKKKKKKKKMYIFHLIANQI